jgi:hypothetical protein
MAYNAAERKDVRRAEKDAKLAEQQRREVIVGLMSAIPGRRWVLETLESCHIFRTSYNRDPTTMAFMEGQRDIGLRLLNDIMASCPDDYIQMMRESNERRSTSERTSSENRDGSDQGPDAPDGFGDAPDDSTDDAATSVN